MAASVAVSGGLVAALIHEGETSSGLLLGSVRRVRRASDELGEVEEEEVSIASYSVGWSAEAALPADTVGMWVSRSVVPPTPTLRDASAMRQLEARTSSQRLVLLSICAHGTEFTYRFTRRFAPIAVRTKLLGHDSRRELGDFHQAASWSAFDAAPRPSDPFTAAFERDRRHLDEVLNQIRLVEAEADDLETKLLATDSTS